MQTTHANDPAVHDSHTENMAARVRAEAPGRSTPRVPRHTLNGPEFARSVRANAPGRLAAS